MRRQQTIVRLDNARCNIGRRVDFKTDFRFLSVVDCKALKNKHTQTRSSSTSDSVSHDETLHVFAIFNQLLQSVVDLVHDFLSSSIMSTSEVVRGIFPTVDDIILMEQPGRWSFFDFITHRGFKIAEKIPWNTLSRLRFVKES